MSVVQPLLDLQAIDSRIRDLQAEISEIPQRKKQENVRLTEAREVLEQAQAELKAAQLKVHEAEQESAVRQEKIQALKQNQALLKTNREFQLYNLEIAKLEGECDNFDSRQVAALDDVIPLKHQVAAAQARLEEEQKRADGYLAELDERLAEAGEEVAEIEVERQEALKGVSQQFLVYYERLRAKRWPVVVGLSSQECVCQGCNLVQPPSVGQMVRRNKELVACQMCGRILYLVD